MTHPHANVAHASVLGTRAFNAGRSRVPAHDPALCELLVGRAFGVTPAGEATTVELFQAWLGAWDAANLSGPLP